jgi:hypothetical protein
MNGTAERGLRSQSLLVITAIYTATAHPPTATPGRTARQRCYRYTRRPIVRPSPQGKLRNAELTLKLILFNARSAGEFRAVPATNVLFDFLMAWQLGDDA